MSAPFKMLEHHEFVLVMSSKRGENLASFVISYHKFSLVTSAGVMMLVVVESCHVSMLMTSTGSKSVVVESCHVSMLMMSVGVESVVVESCHVSMLMMSVGVDAMAAECCCVSPL